jgi:hypothetical protein
MDHRGIDFTSDVFAMAVDHSKSMVPSPSQQVRLCRRLRDDRTVR